VVSTKIISRLRAEPPVGAGRRAVERPTGEALVEEYHRPFSISPRDDDKAFSFRAYVRIAVRRRREPDILKSETLYPEWNGN
jgi:hypothetical protein